MGQQSHMQIKIGSGIASLAIVVAAFSAQASAATARNHAPVISGVAAGSVIAGQQYNFQPRAFDADGNALVYSVTSKPGWARLDRRTGRLYGSPAVRDVGVYEEIEISVTDGMARAKLAKFSITVKPNPALGNAPSISGAPVTTATIGVPYSFKPNAMDLDGDALTFSITGRPSWATLDKSTGRLTGTPTVAGTYSGVQIAVSDGKNTVKLPSFTINVAPAAAAVVTTTKSVTLSWTPPEANTDGSALTNLAGYRILMGTAPGAYLKSVDVSVGMTRYTIDDLPAGTYYFAITAKSSAGAESAMSTEVSMKL